MRNLTTEEFIRKAVKVHGIKYDYSKVNYVNARTKIEIICPIHGSFWQLPFNHLKGQNCPKCVQISKISKASSTTEEFIEKAKKIHGNKYDYSNVDYINNSSKVEIICPIHGSFWQTPNHHLKGHCCPECSRILTSSTTEEFIQKAKEVHGNKYDYSQVNYINNRNKVEIICPKHGSFFQQPNKHLYGSGCSKCSKSYSKQEEEFRQFIKSIYPSAYKTKKGEIIPKQELDVYIPDLKIAFEFNGLYWHDTHYTQTERDERKKKSCEDLDIKLYTIWDNEWKNNKENIKHNIISIFNKI